MQFNRTNNNNFLFLIKSFISLANSDNHFCLIDILSSIRRDDPIFMTIVEELLNTYFIKFALIFEIETLSKVDKR